MESTEVTTIPTSPANVNTTGDGIGQLRRLEHGEIWTPEVTQRVATVVALMVLTFVGNVAVIVCLAPCRYFRRGRRANHPGRSPSAAVPTSPPSRVNVFIVNLAIGDLAVCCFTMTTEVLFVVFEKAWVLGAAACRLLLYIQVVTLASTTFLLTAMSFDRYLAICRPMFSLPAASQPRRWRMVVIAWIMAFIFASPQLVIFKQVPVGIYPEGIVKYKCASKGYSAWWQRKLYFTFMTSYILVIPAVFMTFCYINIILVIWKRISVQSTGAGSRTPTTEAASGRTGSRNADATGCRRNIEIHSPSAPVTHRFRKFRAVESQRGSPTDASLHLHSLSANECSTGTGNRHSMTSQTSVPLRLAAANVAAMSRARMRMVKMTLCIVCSFIACWTPYFAVHLIHIWSEYQRKIPETVYVFAETLALVNSAVNPLLYACFNASMPGCRRRPPPHHRSQETLENQSRTAAAAATGVDGSEFSALRGGNGGRTWPRHGSRSTWVVEGENLVRSTTFGAAKSDHHCMSASPVGRRCDT